MRPTLMTAFACASLLLATTENADAQVFVRPWFRPRVVIVPRPWVNPVSVAPPVVVQPPPPAYYPPQYYYPPAPPAPVYVQPPPVYVQPPCPAPGDIWIPGYWAWDDDYYWVPGTWVLAPAVTGALARRTRATTGAIRRAPSVPTPGADHRPDPMTSHSVED